MDALVIELLNRVERDIHSQLADLRAALEVHSTAGDAHPHTHDVYVTVDKLGDEVANALASAKKTAEDKETEAEESTTEATDKPPVTDDKEDSKEPVVETGPPKESSHESEVPPERTHPLHKTVIRL